MKLWLFTVCVFLLSPSLFAGVEERFQELCTEIIEVSDCGEPHRLSGLKPLTDIPESGFQPFQSDALATVRVAQRRYLVNAPFPLGINESVIANSSVIVEDITLLPVTGRARESAISSNRLDDLGRAKLDCENRVAALRQVIERKLHSCNIENFENQFSQLDARESSRTEAQSSMDTH